MKEISTSICLGLGDNIVARIIFDTVKQEYSAIRISHDQNIMRIYNRGDIGYRTFLRDIGRLFFTEPPFIFSETTTYQPIHTFNTIQNLPNRPVSHNLQHLLCRGTPLDLGEEYIVISTKIRGISKKKFLPLSAQLWRTLQNVSQKYKIVVVGEREVERNMEYTQLSTDNVYEIYSHIMANIPSDRVVDLTVPALGNTAPTLVKIQQDGLIMQQAKCVITFGLGGNVWLAIATSNRVIGFRAIEDNDGSADMLLSKITNTQIVKDWNHFVSMVGGL